MSAVLRRVHAFKKGRHDNPWFPWWDKACLNAGDSIMMTLDVVSDAEMDRVLSKKDCATIIGLPIYISCNRAETTVRVYPMPAQDYDAVMVET